MVGAYTTFSCTINPEAKAIFEEALKGFTGVKYLPVAVATQVVSGTNYCFFCNAKGAYPGSIYEAAMVYIFKPLDGAPHITEIKRL